MIINKKYVRENYPKGYKYLYFISYLNLDLIFLNSFVLGWPLSPAQHIIGRKRDAKKVRYI
jgi:hypothetical protein